MGVFNDLNEVKIIGNITNDIELNRTSNGSAVTNFGVATNRSYKMGDDWKEETTFHNIVVWGTDAEQLEKRARKGTKVFISGRLQTRKWEGQDGKMNYKTEVVSDRITLLDRYEKTGGSGGSAPQPNSSAMQTESNLEETIDPDDLPF